VLHRNSVARNSCSCKAIEILETLARSEGFLLSAAWNFEIAAIRSDRSLRFHKTPSESDSFGFTGWIDVVEFVVRWRATC